MVKQLHSEYRVQGSQIESVFKEWAFLKFTFNRSSSLASLAIHASWKNLLGMNKFSPEKMVIDVEELE